MIDQEQLIEFALMSSDERTDFLEGVIQSRERMCAGMVGEMLRGSGTSEEDIIVEQKKTTALYELWRLTYENEKKLKQN